MLVCSVSQPARRVAIAAGVAEAAAALDALAAGIVFAALVDDPASASDRLDAFLGQIMRETATAAATVNAGLTYAVRIDEAAFAAVLLTGAVPTAISAAVAEAASAADAPDAAKLAGARFEGVLALDGPIMPTTPEPTVIYLEG
jgi:predicted anti-sigma-YlaC factor YlaD